jgi:hypothetical protein
VGDPEIDPVVAKELADSIAKGRAEIAQMMEAQKARREAETKKAQLKVIPLEKPKSEEAERSKAKTTAGKVEALKLTADLPVELKKAKTCDEALKEEIVIDRVPMTGVGEGFTYRDSKEEPKAEPKAEGPKEEAKTEGPKDADEEEGLKAEGPVPGTDLNQEEEKKRRLIRWMKLKQLNVKYAVIRSYGGKCAIVTIGHSKGDLNKRVFEFQTKEAFEQWMANQFIPSLKKQNEKNAVGPWWFQHPLRREYDSAIFKPLAPGVITTPSRLKILNMYLGWGVEPKEGDWSLIRQHIRNVLANGDEGTDNYIIFWIAWNLQHPDRLPEVALTLIGHKGTGKGTLARLLRIIFGSHSVQVSNIRHLTGNFNAYKENLILLVADEAYWGGHKGEAGELQRMITEDTLFIEPKFFNQYEAKNYIRLLILAEPGWVIPAGPNERRYAVFDVSERHLEDRKYFKALHHQIDNGGAAAMLYDLQRMDLGDWHPRQVYKTAAFRRQQDMSLGHLEEWLLTLLESGCLPSPAMGKPWASGPTTLLNDAKWKVPRCRDLSYNSLSAFLLKWGCRQTGGDDRYYHFPPLAKIRTAWDQRYAPREWPPREDWGLVAQPSLKDLLEERL